MTQESPSEAIDLNNPPFTPTDRRILSTPDSQFNLTTWPDLHHIITHNTLEDLKRRPSDLHRYLLWAHKIRQTRGGIVPYVIRERLKWEPVRDPTGLTSGPYFRHHSDVPFEDERDFAVLLNDWPYGFEPGITHLLVWSKTPIATDDREGDVTPESRRLIHDFVQNFFVKDLGGDEAARQRVLWFKNWVSLQSVRGVDHVHVLVKNATPKLLEKWTERKDI
ncbi:hypothetical protein EJ03DRAFT_60060 [Teratosphaeria nubilosa]|uniref:N-acetylglucosamine-induced protein 1 n=1 Tax=Teratosphaeria nubilosa TaxID=161662 RepID=A0A6G1LCQ2_9PEZI|nr:hypothetical protein EJ03DRAFT_60060 [Teratosphaeria nubilosa]